MQELYSLIQNLTSKEWQALCRYFTCFSDHSPDQNKSLRLAELLLNSKKCPDESYCCLKMYGSKKHEGFDMLKSRLRDKVLDFIITDICTDKKQELDEVDVAIVKIKKRSAQFWHLYYSRNRSRLLYSLIDEIISLAKKYEHYPALLESLKLKKTLNAWKAGSEEFDMLHAEIAKYLGEYSLLIEAEHKYYQLSMQQEFISKRNKNHILISFKDSIAALSHKVDKSNSSSVKYFFMSLEMGYFELEKDYLRARSRCLEILNLARLNPCLQRKQRIGIIYDNLSRCEYHLNNYAEAAECARKAQGHFKENSENYSIALEQENYALFALGQFESCESIIHRILSITSQSELGDFLFSKYNFLLCNALFKQRKYENVLELLAEERALSKDKAGWEIGAKVLGIMTFIETQKLDEARLAVFSLREYLKYNNKKTPISKRDRAILNLLLILERAGFMFALLNGSTEKHLENLRSQDEDLRWEPFTHELIPFHEWFAGKMKRKMPLPALKIREAGTGEMKPVLQK